MEDSKKAYICTKADYEQIKNILDLPAGRRHSLRQAYEQFYDCARKYLSGKPTTR